METDKEQSEKQEESQHNIISLKPRERKKSTSGKSDQSRLLKG